jgi:hypothetical protein
LTEVKKSPTNVRLVASIHNFESAYFDEELSSEKPYTAIQKIKTSKESLDNSYPLKTEISN